MPKEEREKIKKELFLKNKLSTLRWEILKNKTDYSAIHNSVILYDLDIELLDGIIHKFLKNNLKNNELNNYKKIEEYKKGKNV